MPDESQSDGDVSTFWLMTKGDTRKKLELDIQECVGRTTERSATWAQGWDRIFHSNAIHRTNRYNPEQVQIQASQKTDVRNGERSFVYGAWWRPERASSERPRMIGFASGS